MHPYFPYLVFAWLVLLTIAQYLIVSGVDMLRSADEWWNEATARTVVGVLALAIGLANMLADLF